MPYRKRKTYSRKLKQARDEVPESYPLPLPELRRVITVTDLDFGECTHRIELYKTNRVDCYNMMVDGKPYQYNVGWSSVLEIIRKQFIRVRAM